MAQSVRERTSELAVLKTLGFSGRLVLIAGAGRVAVHRAARRRARPRRCMGLLVSRGSFNNAILPVFIFTSQASLHRRRRWRAARPARGRAAGASRRCG